MFDPIQTERLVIRSFVADDATGLAERRSDPVVAKYQAWPVPFALAQAQELVSELGAMDGPENEEWWMAAVCDASSGQVLGDLAVKLSWDARTAEVGYTFASEHWGNGYAHESLDGMITYLYDSLDVTRVFGSLHPENVASAMVLERAGLLWEGHTHSSFWMGTEVSDDWIYGMTRADWDHWKNRPRTRPESVGLVGISHLNYESVLHIATTKTQERFVSPIGQSFADALFPRIARGEPVEPWLTAIEADGELVGFVMLDFRTDQNEEPFLRSLLIDRFHQRRGIGGRVVDLVAAECLARGARSVSTRWLDGKGSPGPFFVANGFEPLRRIADGEIEAHRSW